MSRNDDILRECHDRWLDPFGEDSDECTVCSGALYDILDSTCDICDEFVCMECKVSCEYCKERGCKSCMKYDPDTGLYFCPEDEFDCKDRWYEENPE